MSGIEVAGLVLGAFPLILKALESYREGAEVVKDWWRIEQAYEKTHEDVTYHQILFEGNVERFLLPLVVDDNELHALMSDAAGKGWQDAQLEVRLHQRLPKSYNLFLAIIKNIKRLVDALKSEIGVEDKLGPLSKRSVWSRANMRFQTKRLKFAARKSARQQLFTQLQDANERMRSLLENNDQIIAARQMVYTAAQVSVASTISLAEVLRNTHSMTRRKRYFMALSLASSFLQLGTTPWLSTHLRKESIMFFKDFGQPDTTSFSHPYIRQEFSDSNGDFTFNSVNSLGIRLLELCFGISVETTKVRKRFPAFVEGVAPHMLDYCAAIHWSGDVYDEAGLDFYEAIRWCLKQRTLTHGSWRKAMWQHVIAPLDRCHECVSGLSSPRAQVH